MGFFEKKTKRTRREGVDMITDEDVAYFKGMRDGVEWMIEKLKGGVTNGKNKNKRNR